MNISPILNLCSYYIEEANPYVLTEFKIYTQLEKRKQSKFVVECELPPLDEYELYQLQRSQFSINVIADCLSFHDDSAICLLAIHLNQTNLFFACIINIYDQVFRDFCREQFLTQSSQLHLGFKLKDSSLDWNNHNDDVLLLSYDNSMDWTSLYLEMSKLPQYSPGKQDIILEHLDISVLGEMMIQGLIIKE